jgi:hypothetical protein
MTLRVSVMLRADEQRKWTDRQIYRSLLSLLSVRLLKGPAGVGAVAWRWAAQR